MKLIKLNPSVYNSRRIQVITNDNDFAEFSKEDIFSVIWLRIPQDKPQLLIDSFSRLLKQKSRPEDFKGKLITIYKNKFEVSELE